MVKNLQYKIKNHPASYWKRFVAYMIDVFIIYLIIVIPFGDHLKKFDNTFTFLQADKSLFFISLIIVLLTLLYFVILEFKYKQTIGKMFFDIYVASEKGDLSLQQIILRNITKPFSIVFIIDVAYMLFKRNNQRLFEVFSNTLVVEKGVALK